MTASLLFVLGCEPGDVNVQLLVYDKKTDSYALDEVTIKTLDNVGRLEGEATSLSGGSSITLDYQSNQLRWKSKGNSVAFEAIDQGGVLIPEDYHSMAMASIYYNIEQSREFFIDDLHLPASVVGSLTTYYWADFTIIESSGTATKMKDNAFYMYMSENEQAFFIVPFDEFQWVPMPLNGGIITHEYAHAVFENLVHPSKSTPGMTIAAANFLYGLNEGCSDYFAVARTEDPSFIKHSVPENLYETACSVDIEMQDVVRNASLLTPYTQAFDQAARNTPYLDFCPYDVGRFWASMLYEIARSLPGNDEKEPSRENLRRVAIWLKGALVDLGEELRNDFELWDVMILLVNQIETPADKDVACGVLENTYSLHYTAVTGC